MDPYFTDGGVSIYHGDCRQVLSALGDEYVQTCVTSPPYYGLRDYGVDGQIGLEQTPQQYVDKLVEVFRGVRRALRDDGTLWLNLGDSYASSPKGSPGVRGNINCGKRDGDGEPTQTSIDKSKLPGIKPKDLIGIPWRVAFALQSDGWYLRQDIIWHKPNPMPESVRDRCTKAHEYMFLLSKSERYFYDAAAVAEESKGRERFGNWVKGQPCPDRHDNSRQDMTPTKTRNRRSVWTITPRPYRGAHFATFPPELVWPCIMAGSKPGDLVLDPFHGAGTTGLVARELGRRYVGVELNQEYIELSKSRLAA